MDSWGLVEQAQKRTVGRDSVQVQGPQFSLRRPWHAPAATLLPLALDSARPSLSRKVFSRCRAHLVTPSPSGRGQRARKPSRIPICDSAFILGVIWCLLGSSGQDQACLIPLSPAYPGHLPRKWPWEHRGAHRHIGVYVPVQRACIPATVLEALLGAEWVPREAKSGWGGFAVGRGQGLQSEWCWLV